MSSLLASQPTPQQPGAMADYVEFAACGPSKNDVQEGETFTVEAGMTNPTTFPVQFDLAVFLLDGHGDPIVQNWMIRNTVLSADENRTYSDTVTAPRGVPGQYQLEVQVLNEEIVGGF